jgi:pimeloyl-ACP methyl ester carboxylesterase
MKTSDTIVEYWKKNYLQETDATVIEQSLRIDTFDSGGKSFDLLYFEFNKQAPCILLSQGSYAHAYVFAELAFHIHSYGYNVFVMPRHGDSTISELMTRHEDAVTYIFQKYQQSPGICAEGLGGLAAFYLTLRPGNQIKSAVFLNAPAVLTDPEFHKSFTGGGGTADRRRRLMIIAKAAVKIIPSFKIPIKQYLDLEEMIDVDPENYKRERELVDAFTDDPDFDTHYSLSSVYSLVSTPPPGPLNNLKVPTMFIVLNRGFIPDYFKKLYEELPCRKKIKEVNAGVFWMLSQPKQAAVQITEWFNETLK